MRILLLGSGGREHALAWKLNYSEKSNLLFIAPGNPGTALYGKNIPLDLNDFEAIGKFCVDENIEMLVVGPEEPLVNGLFDHFKSKEELKSRIIKYLDEVNEIPTVFRWKWKMDEIAIVKNILH